MGYVVILFYALTHILTKKNTVSKATLDIISLAAFGYKTDSLTNPDNELAVAYHELLKFQECTYKVCRLRVCRVNRRYQPGISKEHPHPYARDANTRISCFHEDSMGVRSRALDSKAPFHECVNHFIIRSSYS